MQLNFSYNAKEALRLNFESILESLKKKLNLWKWENLTILGRIQIVKSFAISKFLYRASQISFPKEIIKSANTIIYDFIWKGKDKVKRRALINNIENGGLKTLHLESLIEAQKISFFKGGFLHYDSSARSVGPTVSERKSYVYFDTRFTADS